MAMQLMVDLAAVGADPRAGRIDGPANPGRHVMVAELEVGVKVGPGPVQLLVALRVASGPTMSPR